MKTVLFSIFLISIPFIQFAQENLRLDSIIFFDFNSPNDSVYYQKDVYDYKNDYSYTKNIFYWDTISSLWNHKAIIKYTYNEYDSLLLYEQYFNYGFWVGEVKTETVYKNDGISKSVFYYKWDASKKDWNYDERIDWEYNDSLKITLYAEYKWSGDFEDWVGNSKTETLYNQNVKTELIYDPVWGIDLWKLYSKNAYYYNSRNQLDSCFSYYWNESDSSWSNRSKSILSYDTINYTSIENYYEWKWNIDSYQWILDEIFERQYNDDWQLIDQKRYILDNEGNADLRQHLIYEYNSDGDLICYTSNSYKYLYGYTESGSRYVYEMYFWNSANNSWRGSFKFTDSLSIDGLVKYHISEKWDNELSQWYVSSKQTIYLDENGNVLLNVLENWQQDTQTWQLTKKTYYYYSKTTDIKSLANDNINIYPNPTNDILNISGISQPFEVKIYSISGNLIIDRFLNQNQINISDIPDGTYIFKILKGKKIQKLKKIIKH